MLAIETLKQIEIGADVIDSAWEKVGTVGYVIVRPADMRITDLVVRTGVILGREIVIPVDVIHDVRDGKVYLEITKEEVKEYPDYIEVNYEGPPSGWTPPVDLAYPPSGILWPAGSYYSEPVDIRVNAPPGTLGLRKGMDVESSDRHRVGVIESLDVDLKTGEITGFVVKRGHLFTHETLLPVGDVKTIRPGTVILNLTRDQVKDVEKAQNPAEA